jgi:hypothetical protein
MNNHSTATTRNPNTTIRNCQNSDPKTFLSVARFRLCGLHAEYRT